MRLRKDDKVQITKGKDAGKTGKILAVVTKTNKVLVEGINIVKRHVKPGVISKEGGIISIERPVAVSNVMPICPKCSSPMRVGYKIEGNKKFRVCKKCNEVLVK